MFFLFTLYSLVSALLFTVIEYLLEVFDRSLAGLLKRKVSFYSAMIGPLTFIRSTFSWSTLNDQYVSGFYYILNSIGLTLMEANV